MPKSTLFGCLPLLQVLPSGKDWKVCLNLIKTLFYVGPMSLNTWLIGFVPESETVAITSLTLLTSWWYTLLFSSCFLLKILLLSHPNLHIKGIMKNITANEVNIWNNNKTKFSCNSLRPKNLYRLSEAVWTVLDRKIYNNQIPSKTIGPDTNMLPMWIQN